MLRYSAKQMEIKHTSYLDTLVFLNYGSVIRVNITFLLKAQN